MSCLKKVSLSVAALSVAATVFAGSDMDSRVRELEKEMKEVRTGNPAKTFGANTAPARPEVQGTDFFVSFDVLYWQAKLGGTEYCYTNGNSGVTMPERGSVHDANPEWDWGFRAGIGYNFEHGQWDVYANYTYFSSNHGTMKTGSPTGSVMPLKGGSAVHNYTSAAKATSHVKLNFDRIDLELGRDFFVAEYLSFRPHFGLMTAWIDTTQSTRYSGGDNLGYNYVYVRDTNDFWGIGPRAGVNSKWHLANGFSIFGNAATALTYGNFDVHHKENYSVTSSTNSINLNGGFHRFVPTTQLQLGFAYDQYVADDKQHISLSLGWDIQYWWSVNQSLNTVHTGLSAEHGPTYDRASEDLSLQGITLHFMWCF